MDDYAAGSRLILPVSDETESALLRRAVAALGPFAGEGLQPNGSRSARFLGGDGDATGVHLRHPAYSALNSWINVSVAREDFNEIFLTIHLDEPGDNLGLDWEMAVALTSQLVVSLDPRLAHLTAWHIDGHGKIYPSTRLLPSSQLPEEFGPWTYICGEWLTGPLRDQLASLPAYASHALGNGWLTRAVKHPADEPTQSFLDALTTLDREPISYRRPRLAAA